MEGGRWGVRIIFTEELHLVWHLASSWALHTGAALIFPPSSDVPAPVDPAPRGYITRSTRYVCTQNKKCVSRICSFHSPIVCLFPYFQSRNDFFFWGWCVSGQTACWPFFFLTAVFHDMKTSLRMLSCPQKCTITELVRCLKYNCEPFNLNSLKICLMTFNLNATKQNISS